MQQLPQLRVALVAKRWHVCACACVALLFWCAAAAAQRASPADGTKTYSLQHQAAPEVARTLSELLGNEVEVTINARENQLSVRGPAKSQWAAEQLIAAVDQPRGQRAANRAASLRKYPCPREQAAARLEALQKRYRGYDRVRIAADPESGQITALAPDEIQAEIGQQ